MGFPNAEEQDRYVDDLVNRLDVVHSQLVDPINSKFLHNTNKKQAVKSLYKIVFAAEDMIKFLQESQVYSDLIKSERK